MYKLQRGDGVQTCALPIYSNAEVLTGDYAFYTCASEPSRTDTFAYDDTVILVAGNNAAGNFHINRHKGKFNAYQRTYIFTSKHEYELEYLYQVLKTETVLLKSQGKGSQTKFLTIGMLTGINTFTKTGIMENYDKIAKPIYEHQVVIKLQNQKLTELRDWLLPMLMNGQVKVTMEEEVETELLMAAEPKVGYGQ
jgi:type I restriction enzyme S subunit